MQYRILLTLCMPLCAPPSALADACGDIRTLAASAESKFSGIRESYDPEMEEFATNFSLPGADHCYIERDDEFDDAQYVCVWSMNSLSEAEGAYQSMIADIERCTGAAGRSRGAHSNFVAEVFAAHVFKVSRNDRRELYIHAHGDQSKRNGRVHIFFTLEYDGSNE